MNKVIGTFGIVFISFFLFTAGVDSSHHFYSQMVLDLLLAGFFFAMAAVITLSEVHEAINKARHHSHKEEADQMVKDLVSKLDEAFVQKSEPERDIELAMAIAKDVLHEEKREATPEEVARIEAAFHDQTDGEKYLKVHMTSSEGMEMEVSSEPIEDGSANPQEAVTTATTTRRVIPVVDGDAPAPKPLTKSQQRRINAKKGLGPLTDDEVREQKNAKRREARAAKKALTTSTTTQPGQTKLI